MGSSKMFFTRFNNGQATAMSQTSFDYAYAALSRGSVHEFQRVLPDNQWSDGELAEFLALAVDKQEGEVSDLLLGLPKADPLTDKQRFAQKANPSIALHHVRTAQGVKTLLEYKANVGYLYKGKSVLQEALKLDREQVVSVLIEQKMNIDNALLEGVVLKGWYGFVEPMLKQGASLDAKWVESLADEQILSQERKSDIAEVLTASLRDSKKETRELSQAIAKLTPNIKPANLRSGTCKEEAVKACLSKMVDVNEIATYRIKQGYYKGGVNFNPIASLRPILGCAVKEIVAEGDYKALQSIQHEYNLKQRDLVEFAGYKVNSLKLLNNDPDPTLQRIDYHVSLHTATKNLAYINNAAHKSRLRIIVEDEHGAVVSIRNMR